MSSESDIRELLDICKKLPELGLATGSTGNISARDQGSGNIIIKCSGVPYSEIEYDDFAVLDSEGNILSIKDGRKPSTETPSHVWIYKKHKSINAIQHTHLKYAIILSPFYESIPCAVTPTGLRLFEKPIPVIDFVKDGSQEMAESLAPHFENNAAIIIKNHGAFTVGDAVGAAFARTVALDDLTNIYYHMLLLGKPTLICS
jgi:L-ribulose-5-phosphate 4-epimerase